MIAFVFPGQGSQQVGMGKSLASAFPICRETLEHADSALGESLSSLCFDGPDDTLMLTENTQPAILAVSVAVYRLLVSRGISPDFVAVWVSTPHMSQPVRYPSPIRCVL